MKYDIYVCLYVALTVAYIFNMLLRSLFYLITRAEDDRNSISIEACMIMDMIGVFLIWISKITINNHIISYYMFLLAYIIGLILGLYIKRCNDHIEL